MEWTFTKAREKWSITPRIEKNYILTWMVIGISMAICEVLMSFNLQFKHLHSICFILCISFGLYLFILPFFIKSFSDKLPFAAFIADKDEWKSRRTFIIYDIIFIISIINISRLFDNLNVMVKIVFLIAWLILFFFGSIFNEKVVYEVTKNPPLAISPSRVLTIFVVSSFLVLIVLAYMIYNTWYK